MNGAFIHSFGFYYGVRSYILCGIELCSVYIDFFFVGADIESFVYFPLGLQNISCLWLVLWVMSISARDRLVVFG